MSSEIIAKDANAAFSVLKTLSNEQRSSALEKIYQGLKDKKDQILNANKQDLQLAKEKNLLSSLIKRLDLTSKFDDMLQGILDVASLPDPVGKVTLAKKLDDDLNLYRITSPIGVLLIIFEARPEVIANITALAIKSGNCAILKGGKESFNTFKEMSDIVNSVLSSTNVPSSAIQLIESRDDVSGLLSQDKYIDLVIPRGSNELVRNIKENTKIPVLGHADGICSIYVDDKYDLTKAKRIIIDSKTNYPAGCNAAEQLLLNRNISKDDILSILSALVEAKVTIHITEELAEFTQGLNTEYIKKADDTSFDKEYLSFDISVKFIDNVDAAITHINAHSSKHTECIITEDEPTASKFLKGIDSAGIYWNASTRFADGFRYGFGTEVGISTNKIHARGPVGLEGLMSYQYQLRGNGHIASEYKGAGGSKTFVHEDIDLSKVKL